MLRNDLQFYSLYIYKYICVCVVYHEHMKALSYLHNKFTTNYVKYIYFTKNGVCIVQ